MLIGQSDCQVLIELYGNTQCCPLTLQILIVPLGEIQHCLGRTFRCLDQALPVGILAETAQQQTIGARHIRKQCLTCWRLMIQLQIVMKSAVLMACKQIKTKERRAYKTVLEIHLFIDNPPNPGVRSNWTWVENKY